MYWNMDVAKECVLGGGEVGWWNHTIFSHLGSLARAILVAFMFQTGNQETWVLVPTLCDFADHLPFQAAVSIID